MTTTTLLTGALARALGAGLLALGLTAPPPAMAQGMPGYGYGQPAYGQLPIVGMWSATLRRSNGQPSGSMFLQIGPGGQFAQRMITVGGMADYAGAYQFDPGSGVLTFVVNGYQPQPPTLPPMLQPGVPYRFQLMMQGPNTMLLQDAGGPIELHRQG